MADSGALLEILAKLKRSSRRLTPQRMTILQVVLDSREHLDADQIRARSSAHGARVSYATVYRTLRMLVDEGLIKQRNFKDGSARFEYVKEGDHHDHLICTNCGQVSEFNHPTIESLQEQVALDYRFEMTGHRHEIYGLCFRCSSANTETLVASRAHARTRAKD